ncbi:putative transcriptional regulatory protein YedW [Sporotomaculum syntrophicum]|uniref:Stage 0 sporulation protein A homolog n=1 Tax=Sporotomaculum syntrophicum TaxID=182264 RepID=A0A9D2WP92_9FIRM|nr:response regulator transcription factor [Sporotomaculum syntrophicum]KAF1084924.1 putative transcriptional regulatory protein YedW [Sporotomaculum syntrophicum]
MSIQILVVEDDARLQDMVCKFLRKEGWLVDACIDGKLALERFYENKYDLIILDIMLPGINGQELLRELRKIHDTPVLMMTALSDDDNQLRAFEGQTDDYVTKPFSMSILVKRTEALLRRSGVLKKEIQAGKLILYPETYGAEYDGEKILLTPKEFEILELFVRNAGKIVPHETFLTRIWGYDFEGNEGIIHASIKKLRDKLPEKLIRTVKGVGYYLEANNNKE